MGIWSCEILNYLLLFLVFGSIKAVTTVQGYYTVIRDSHLAAEYKPFARPTSQMDCFVRCARSVDCSGASYSLGEGICEVIFVDETDNIPVEESPGWLRLIINRKGHYVSASLDDGLVSTTLEGTNMLTTVPDCIPPLRKLLDNCYYILQAKMLVDFDDALNFCAEKSADLASVETLAEFEAIKAELIRIYPLIKPMTQYGWMVGATFNPKSGFQWLTGDFMTPGTFIWDSEQPNGGDCLAFSPPEFNYMDISCNVYGQQFICKK